MTTYDNKVNKIDKMIKTVLTVLGIEMILAAIVIPVAIILTCKNNNSDVIFINRDHADDVIEETSINYNSVYAWQVYGGDFGEEQMNFLKQQCEKYEIPMEIMLSIICTESGFRSDAKASTSSAAGYCQVLSGSAEWVYEDLLKYGEYDTANHAAIMTINWKLNIEIGCRIMYCWYWNCNESWELAIQRYHGGSEEAKNTYLNAVNDHMNELFGMSVADLK